MSALASVPFDNSRYSSRRDRLKIAQRFNAGWRGPGVASPGGTTENEFWAAHSAVPPGLVPAGAAIPALKRWAIFAKSLPDWSMANSRKALALVLRSSSAVRLLPLLTILLLGIVPHSADGADPFAPAMPHTNGLGMRFVPVFLPVPKTTVLFSVYETRVKDFRVFVRETGYVHLRETKDPNSRMWSLDRDGNKQRGHSWENPGFTQTDEHPVVGVNWYDAKAFCEWLTLRERAAGRLPANREYRLPRDHEWSVAVGLTEEAPDETPEEKHWRIKDRYPWGEWPEGQPPPARAGNYAGAEVDDDGHWPTNFTTLAGYRDEYARTAPVGSFKPNALGIYDLGGNVWEWCEDEYRPGAGSRVGRGASWYDRVRDDLLSSIRHGDRPMGRDGHYGFRCVVGVSSP